MKWGNALLLLSVVSLLSLSGYSMGEEYMGGVSDTYKFTGENISFSFNMEDWAVENITVYNVSIIDKICLPPSYYSSMSKMQFGNFHIQTSDYNISVNSISGSGPSVSYSAIGDSAIKIYLKNGVSVSRDGVISIEKSGVKGDIVTDGSIEIEGKVIKISLEKGERALFRFYEKMGSESETISDAVSDALKLHRIGAEARLDMKKGNLSVMPYNNISIEPVRITDKRAVLKISSDEHEGKSIVLHISMEYENMSVLLDGKNVSKGSYYDALFSTGNESVYNITESEGSITLIVYIPHFSEHTLTIEEENVSAENSVNPQVSGESGGFGIISVLTAIALSALAGMALFWKRR